jgi:hypothetical protein
MKPSFWMKLLELGRPAEAAAALAEETAAKTRPVVAPVARAQPPMPNFERYPSGYEAGAVAADGVTQPKVFEPCLTHFPRAYRLGEPEFADAAAAAAWRQTRMVVMEHVLRLTARSKWRDHLVLRGSIPLKAWLGDAARTPGDIDWVVTPQSLKATAPFAEELIQGLAHCVMRQPNAGEAVIDVDRIALDEIWTYDRAPGRRIVFPWSLQGVAMGAVQMDLVFEEALLADPEWLSLRLQDGEEVKLRAATRELALAWKLLWLENDIHPQGKDLYDATLLAEQTHLRLELLMDVLKTADFPPSEPVSPGFPMRWDVDWENFKLEYPRVAGDVKEWQARLTAALAPTFRAA